MTRSHSKLGFTLIELMIAVFVVGVIAAIAVPTFARYMRNARAATFVSDIRSLANAADQYAMESGGWVPATSAGTYPTELDGYFSQRKFELGSSLGGHWDFDSFDAPDYYASAVGVQGPSYGDEIFAIVDSRLDDGNLSSGIFQKTADGRYLYIIEE